MIEQQPGVAILYRWNYRCLDPPAGYEDSLWNRQELTDLHIRFLREAKISGFFCRKNTERMIKTGLAVFRPRTPVVLFSV